jgi:hypothetical protein
VKHFGGIASFSIGEGKIPDAVIEEAKWQIGHGNGAGMLISKTAVFRGRSMILVFPDHRISLFLNVASSFGNCYRYTNVLDISDCCLE